MNDDIEYNVEDAARIVYDNVSLELRLKVSPDDIMEILDIEFDYQQRIGLTDADRELCGYPYPIDEAEMESYIISESSKAGITITSNDLEEILDAELIYLKKIGLIDEEGMQAFNN